MKSTRPYAWRLASACALALLVGCGSSTTEMPPIGTDSGMVMADTGVGDAPPDARDVTEEPECAADDQCDDGTFCDGRERCVAGHCTPGTPPCDDRFSCTADTCDEEADTCAHAPDDGMCDDHNACDGAERCAPTTPGARAPTG